MNASCFLIVIAPIAGAVEAGNKLFHPKLALGSTSTWLRRCRSRAVEMEVVGWGYLMKKSVSTCPSPGHIAALLLVNADLFLVAQRNAREVTTSPLDLPLDEVLSSATKAPFNLLLPLKPLFPPGDAGNDTSSLCKAAACRFWSPENTQPVPVGYFTQCWVCKGGTQGLKPGKVLLTPTQALLSHQKSLSKGAGTTTGDFGPPLANDR